MKLVIPYSFHRFIKKNQSFDIMIKYGDEDTYDFMREGYVKNGRFLLECLVNQWNL